MELFAFTIDNLFYATGNDAHNCIWIPTSYGFLYVYMQPTYQKSNEECERVIENRSTVNVPVGDYNWYNMQKDFIIMAFSSSLLGDIYTSWFSGL